MSVPISYQEANSNLESILDRVAASAEILVIERPGKNANVALIAEKELLSLLESVYLLKSPANAARLHEAIARSQQRQSTNPIASSEIDNTDPQQAIALLCEELGIVR